MNKNLTTILILVNLAAVITIAVLFFTKPQKVVYVDTVKLMDNYKGMIDARAAFQKKTATWKANIDTLTSEVQKSIMDYEKGVAKMTKKEKDLSQQLIRTKQEQLQGYQKAMQDKYQQEDNQMTQQVVTKVDVVIKQYGQDKNYRLILGANGSGNIVYAEEGVDITDEVLEVLNNNYLGK